MVRIITVAREYGSGGAGIANALAHRLDWRLVDDPLIAELASISKSTHETLARLYECADPWFHCIVRALWRAACRIDDEPFEGANIGQWTNPHLYHLMLCSCVGLERPRPPLCAPPDLSADSVRMSAIRLPP